MSAMITTIQNYMYGEDFYSKPRKNFIQENMKRIQKIQIQTKEKAAPSKANVPKKPAKKKIIKRGGDGDGDYFIPDLYLNPKNKFEVPVTPETEVQHCRFESKGCQTLPDAKEAYNNGVIVYSRGRPATPPPQDGKRNICIQVNNESGGLYEFRSGLDELPPKSVPVKDDGKIDYVKLNAIVPIKRKVCPSKPDPTKAPANYQKGVLPKYLREAKKQQIEEIKVKGMIEIVDDPDCPEGSERVSEEEKKRHVKEMRKAYAGLVAELNTMPLKSDSLKLKNRRKEIENALENLEAGIKMFSRDNLYVKIAD